MAGQGVAGWLLLVRFPGPDLLAHVPQGAAITSQSRVSVTRRADTPGPVAQV